MTEPDAAETSITPAYTGARPATREPDREAGVGEPMTAPDATETSIASSGPSAAGSDPEERRRSPLRSRLRFWEVAPESVARPASTPGGEPAGDPGWDEVDAYPAFRAEPAWPALAPEPAAAALAGAQPARLGTIAELRSERRELRRRIEAMQFDLGGLHVEMARLARVDHALLEGRALELVAAGDRLAAVERAIAARRRGEDAEWTSVVACSSCGAPRPHDASFCPYCGTPITASERTWRTG